LRLQNVVFAFPGFLVEGALHKHGMVYIATLSLANAIVNRSEKLSLLVHLKRSLQNIRVSLKELVVLWFQIAC